MATGETFARADVNIERDAPLLEQLGKGLDAEPKRRLLEIVGDDQDSAHVGGDCRVALLGTPDVALSAGIEYLPRREC
jgi:hypothetical protein